MQVGDIIAAAKGKALAAERAFLEAVVVGSAQRRAAHRLHRIGPGRRTVFTLARAVEKRRRSKHPYPHQSTKERTRAVWKHERALARIMA